MGVIFQDFVRYELTAGENIGLGQVDALHDATRLLDAAESAGVAELIRQLPDGLDTQLGREFGGRELSDGGVAEAGFGAGLRARLPASGAG